MAAMLCDVVVAAADIRRRAYAPASKTASHDNNETINSYIRMGLRLELRFYLQ